MDQVDVWHMSISDTATFLLMSCMTSVPKDQIAKSGRNSLGSALINAAIIATSSSTTLLFTLTKAMSCVALLSVIFFVESGSLELRTN